MDYVTIAIVSAFVIGGTVIYFTVLRPKMLEVNQTLGIVSTPGLPLTAWLLHQVDHWKTIILSYVAGGAQLLSLIDEDMVRSWSGLPWEQVFTHDLANRITLVCAFLIPLTHTWGLLKAAKTPPVSGS